MKGIFPQAIEMGRQLAQVGLDLIEAIDAHAAAVKTSVTAVNASFILPERVKLIGKIENICTSL